MPEVGDKVWRDENAPPEEVYTILVDVNEAMNKMLGFPQWFKKQNDPTLSASMMAGPKVSVGELIYKVPKTLFKYQLEEIAGTRQVNQREGSSQVFRSYKVKLGVPVVIYTSKEPMRLDVSRTTFSEDTFWKYTFPVNSTAVVNEVYGSDRPTSTTRTITLDIPESCDSSCSIQGGSKRYNRKKTKRRHNKKRTSRKR
jgi:hypothetical protein